MRVLLIFLINIISQDHVFSQISSLPYKQDFENPFLEFGTNVEFIENWKGNEVKNSKSRIFQTDQFVRGGNKALAVQPISSFDGVINIKLDLSEYEEVRLHFYARTRKNGTGSRPIFVSISTTLDERATYLKLENIGDETSFPNQDTEYALYIYDLPISAAHQPNVEIKIEVMYTPAFGEGTAARFIMDDFSVYVKEHDLKIQEIIQVNHDIVQIRFNDEVDKETAEDKANYLFSPTNSILSIERNERSKNTVNLILLKELVDGEHSVKVQNILNINKNNSIDNQEFKFTIKPIPYKPEFNELIITEIMADPSPSIVLPDSEYIEIYNSTNKTLSLKDVVFSDASTSSSLPDIQLSGGEFITIVPKANINLFDGEINLIGISPWPSLNIGGDVLTLTNSTGKLIYSVKYDKSWYKNELKSEGGWSLEMIDINYPCSGKENWGVSADNKGGTPSKINSISANQPDISSLKLLAAIAVQPNKVLLKFNKKILPGSEDKYNFKIYPDINIQSSELHEPLLSSITLNLTDNLQKDLLYEVQVSYLKDCAGNLIDEKYESYTFGLPQPADSLEIIINEILFNARAGGVKFVEIYNNSQKFINLKNWHLGNDIDVNNSSLKSITTEDYIFRPHTYLAITPNVEVLKSEYPKAKDENFLEVPLLPTFTISDGTIVLHDNKGDIVDVVNYSDDYHSPLLRDTKGVSLERISFSSSGMNKSNWQSSASTVGFATPGYRNSQHKVSPSSTKNFFVDPKVFIPDNTGTADFTQINYKFDVQGNHGSLRIYDSKGALVKKIAKNEQLPIEGFFTWDGTNDMNIKVKTGYYLVYFEIYNMNGEIETLKETVVVGKRF